MYLTKHFFGYKYIQKRLKRLLLTAITLTKVVFPEYCSPTNVNSISSFQKRLLNQSKILLIMASMLTSMGDAVHWFICYTTWRLITARSTPKIRSEKMEYGIFSRPSTKIFDKKKESQYQKSTNE